MRLDRTKNTVKNVIFGGLNKVLAILFPFLIRTIMLYTLGIQYLGLNSLFTSIINVLSIAELGFGTALVYSMYKPLAEDDIDKVNALLNLYRKIYKIIGVIVLIAGLSVMPFLNVFINGTVPADVNIYLLYLIFLANGVIGYLFFAYRNAILVVQQRNDVVSNVNSLSLTIMYLIQIAVLLLFRNYYIYIVFLPLSTLAINILIAIITKKKYPQFVPHGEIEEEEKKSIGKQIAALFTHRIGSVIQSSIDNILISAFCGLVLLGKFNNYYYIITAVESFMMIIKQSMLAGVGNSVATESQEYNKRLFYKLVFANLWLVGWCSCCLLCLYQPFMNVWVGETNMLPITIVLCFVIMFYVNNTRNIIGTFKDALGMWWQDRFKPIAISLVNLVGTLISLKFGFFEGVIISTTLAYLLAGIPWETYVFVRGYLKDKQSKYYLKVLGHTIVTAMIVGLCYALCALISVGGILQIIINFAICLIIPNLIYLIIYHRKKEFKELMGMGVVRKTKNLIVKCAIKIRNAFKKAISLTFYIIPINKRKIAVYNTNGLGYGDNPKYLVEEIRKDLDVKVIWIAKNINQGFPEGIIPVKYNSLKAMYHLITSRLWLDTVRNNPRPPFKRCGQYYIQMWHGGLPLKGHEADAEADLSKGYIKAAKKDGKMTDYVLSNCKMRTNLYKTIFWYDGEVLELGIPRDDIFFNLDSDEIVKFKERHNLSDKKICLYAPSFRNSADFYKSFDFDSEKLIKTIQESFGDDFVFCLKLHPNDSESKKLLQGENIIDFTGEPDSQIVLAASDIVISDYSSMLTDFTLTRRPTFVFAPDFEDYTKKQRKLYIDLRNGDLPFADSFDKLIENIKNFDKEKFNNGVDNFLETCGVFEDGNSAKKIKQFLVEKGVLK